MAAFEALDESVEASGEFVCAVVEGLGIFSDEYRKGALAVLADEGIDDPEDDAWYPMQPWLDALERITENVRPTVLGRVGQQVPRLTGWPHDVETVPDALRSVDEEYQRLHRGGDIGYYRFTYVEKKCAEMTAFNPYDCHIDQGLIRGVANNHARPEARVALDESGDECRRDDGDACIYTVYW